MSWLTEAQGVHAGQTHCWLNVNTCLYLTAYTACMTNQGFCFVTRQVGDKVYILLFISCVECHLETTKMEGLFSNGPFLVFLALLCNVYLPVLSVYHHLSVSYAQTISLFLFDYKFQFLQCVFSHFLFCPSKKMPSILHKNMWYTAANIHMCDRQRPQFHAVKHCWHNPWLVQSHFESQDNVVVLPYQL